jgi:hypothetical protein
MAILARIFASLVVLLGTTACLKTNPLVWELADEAYGDSETDTDTAESSDPDMLDTSTASDSDGVCEAPPEFEPECGTCLVENCCTSLEPCGDDPICVCLADCLFAGHGENDCRMQCGGMPMDVLPLAPLMNCSAQDCAHCFEVDSDESDSTADAGSESAGGG